MAGWITLLKYVFTGIPLFSLFLFKMSNVVYKEVKKIQREILWDWEQESTLHGLNEILYIRQNEEGKWELRT